MKIKIPMQAATRARASPFDEMNFGEIAIPSDGYWAQSVWRSNR